MIKNVIEKDKLETDVGCDETCTYRPGKHFCAVLVARLEGFLFRVTRGIDLISNSG